MEAEAERRIISVEQKVEKLQDEVRQLQSADEVSNMRFKQIEGGIGDIKDSLKEISEDIHSMTDANNDKYVTKKEMEPWSKVFWIVVTVVVTAVTAAGLTLLGLGEPAAQSAYTPKVEIVGETHEQV